MPRAQWWKGKRGEWYVAVQLALFVLIIFGPRTATVLPEWHSILIKFGCAIAIIFIISGLFLLTAGAMKLGTNLTPVPYPKENSKLVTSGVYHIVRHPIYSGLIFLSFGWAFFVHGWLTIIYSIVLLVFFDIKSRHEELWLKEKFPNYTAYQKKVHKLIPYIY